MTTRVSWQFGLALTAWGAGATTAAAQLREVREYGTAGFGFVVAQRVSDFELTGATQGGIAAEATFGTFLGVRIGGSVLFSDRQVGTGPLAGPGGPGAGALELNSVVASLGIGPQLSLGAGPLRLYGYGTLGAGYVSIWSSSRYRHGYGAPYAGGGADFDDWTLAAEVGVGAQLRVAGGRGRGTPIYLNVAGRYADHGNSGWVEDDGTVGQHHVGIAIAQVGISFGLR